MTYDDLEAKFPKMTFKTTVSGWFTELEIESEKSYFKMEVPFTVYMSYGPEIFNEVASHLDRLEERLWQPQDNLIL